MSVEGVEVNYRLIMANIERMNQNLATVRTLTREVESAPWRLLRNWGILRQARQLLREHKALERDNDRLFKENFRLGMSI